ncbi:MAG: sporulation integral membrane protein YlbJ [Clostridium sp.]
MIYFLWAFIFILLILLIKQLNLNKNNLIVFLISFIIILFVVNLNISMKAALYGAELWFKALLPTILPFTALCNLLMAYGGIDIYSKVLGPFLCKPLNLSKASSFPLIASFLCGYPLGAKYTSDLYNDGSISRNEFIRLGNIATNCGPIFIMGSVALTMLNNPKAGYILLFSNYASIFIIAFLTKSKNSNSIVINEKTFDNNKSFGDNLKVSIENAINTSLMVGGFVILFCVLISIIKNNAQIGIIFNYTEAILHLPKNCLYGLFLGSIEITNGASIISSLELSIPIKLSLISFLCSFSGLSIIAQASSFLGKYKFPMKRYVTLKFVQGILSFCITFALACIVPLTNMAWTGNYPKHLSLEIFFIPIIILISISFIMVVIKKLFFHSS